MFENLQKTIESFIGKYGTATLIQYLSDYQNFNSKENYDYINCVINTVVSVSSINKNELFDIQNCKSKVVDARRYVVYFISIEKQLPNKILTTLFNCKIRTIYKYKREIKDRLENHHIYKEFTQNHQILKEKINVSTKH